MERLIRSSALVNLMLVLMLAFSTFSASAKERITYFHNDVLGSPVAATDAQGTLLWQEDYTPYGKRLLKQDTGRNARWFTGKSEVAALGVQYFDARWYEADLGRFLSIDPVDFNEGDIHSFNRYAYANNNPYRYVDPNGESPLDVGFLVVDVVKLGVAVYSGVGVAAAAADVGMSVVGVISPVPGTGLALKSFKLSKIAKGVNEAASSSKIANNAGKKIANCDLCAAPNRRGNAPIGKDGHPVELHHRGQNTDGPLDEMTRTDHRLGDNFKNNHSNTGQEASKINRSEWRKEQKQYWKKEYDSGRFKDL